MAKKVSHITLSKKSARAIAVHASGLSKVKPFSDVLGCVRHVGYVQIDTISVIERAHHHILWSRLPGYRPTDLEKAVTHDKTVFEAWAHALAYAPVADFRFYLPGMREVEKSPGRWFGKVSQEAQKKVFRRVQRLGSVTLRDFDDDPRVEKDHEWASNKPSKRALQYLFHIGKLTISQRHGMTKRYAPTLNHFGWKRFPEAANKKELLDHRIDRALRAQGLSTLHSICHLVPSLKPQIKSSLQKRIKAGSVVPIKLEGSYQEWFAFTETLGRRDAQSPDFFEDQIQFLSPFDPLVIQRPWLKEVFDFEFSFEAYVSPKKRKFGYFCLPILAQSELVGLIDLKTDRKKRKIHVQSLHPFKKVPHFKSLVSDALERFESLQFS